ncbi:glycoside hydrolase family 18 protein [Cystobasidium minutum MCA 4210]|uniref:glycoside hydrolase family 18 protein n=1 Tax=Cystobasidium minutum MCA 4210 TaxID=1397322 RepID=UPI0034CD4EBD|eukprot:jgi/Rhomi1/76159/CE76158_459
MRMHSTIFSKAILAAIWSSAVAGQREGPSSHHTKRVTPAKGLISGWVTAWGGNVSMPLYEKYDELTYLGALTTSDGGVNMTVDGDPLQKYIFTQANMTAIRPLLSVGGWAGSQFFSRNVRDDAARQKSATNVTAVVKQFGFGGVDLDWEFPSSKPDNMSHVTGDRGNWCNENHPDDYDNLVKFIQLLRTLLGKDALLCASVPFSGYLDKNQKRVEDASALVSKDALDYISIMTYEMGHHYRHWTGIHAPLHISTKTPWDQRWSIARSVEYWLGAKIPADKIQIGLPGHGKILQTTLSGEAKASLKPNPEYSGSRLYQIQDYPIVQTATPAIWNESDAWNTGSKAIWERDFCGTFRNIEHVKATSYTQLIAEGFLDAHGQAIPKEGRYIEYDRLTESPYIYNSSSGELITYDNPISFGAKSKWAKEKGLLGVKIFSLQHDTLDGALIDAVRQPWIEN